MVNWDNFVSIQNITTSMWATQPLTHALVARPAVQPQSCREMRVKLRNRQNINTTNPTMKETRFSFHYHVTFRVCPTVVPCSKAVSSHEGWARKRRMQCCCRKITAHMPENGQKCSKNARETLEKRPRNARETLEVSASAPSRCTQPTMMVVWPTRNGLGRGASPSLGVPARRAK
jgi:hypothetical protein